MSLLDKLRSTGFSHEVFIPKKLYYDNKIILYNCRNREIILKRVESCMIYDINNSACNTSVI